MPLVGEKGVSGVPGPAVLVVPADVRFMMRELVLMGAMMLEDAEVRDVLDCEADKEVVWSSGDAFGALSLLENRPILLSVCERVRPISSRFVSYVGVIGLRRSGLQ